ncbi:MAG: phosphoribosyltransferase family protein [Patescibacteria group bacterium]
MSEVIGILKKVGAIITDSHFVGTSGLHFDTYINKDALLPHTEEVSRICQIFAEKYKDDNIEVVVSPAVAGIPFSQWTAYHLTKICKKEILSVFTEKTPENDQIFKRGYEEYVKEKRVLILEDSTQTGGSVMKVVKSVKQAGGKVIGVCVIVNKDAEKINAKSLGVAFDSLAELPVQTYRGKDCPLCKKGIPINTVVGHGKKFLEKKK